MPTDRSGPTSAPAIGERVRVRLRPQCEDGASAHVAAEQGAEGVVVGRDGSAGHRFAVRILGDAWPETLRVLHSAAEEPEPLP